MKLHLSSYCHVNLRPFRFGVLDRGRTGCNDVLLGTIFRDIRPHYLPNSRYETASKAADEGDSSAPDSSRRVQLVLEDGQSGMSKQ
jgi:hypothetical protein